MALASSYHQLPLFPTEPTEKVCTGCGLLFPLADFYRKRGTHDGLTTACKDCIKARVRAYQVQNQEKIRASRSARYEANPEQVKAQSRARYQRNREACLEQKRIAYEPERERRKALRQAREQAAAGVQEKQCSRCERLLPLEEFYSKRSGRYGRTAHCKECIKERALAWHWEHRERSNATSTAYYEANREELKAAASAYGKAHRADERARYAANAERERAYQRAWRQANLERIRERERAYRRIYEAEHHEDVRRRRLAWQRAHAEKMREANRRSYEKQKSNGKHRLRMIRRRALECGAEGRFTLDDVRSLYVAQDGLCAYCAVSLNDSFHIDHVVPLSRGGSNWPDNLAAACARCNRSKGAKTAEEFRALLSNSQER